MTKVKKTKKQEEQSQSVSKVNPAVVDIASKLNHKNSDSISDFGLKNQRKLSQYSDEILDKMKTKNAGEVGDTINNLLKEINYIDLDSVNENSNFFVKSLSKIPGMSKIFNKAENTLSKYKSVSENINSIVDQLDNSRMRIQKDTTLLEVMYEKNTDYIKELTLDIEAGHLKVKEMEDEVIPQMKEELKKSNDDLKAQELNDAINFTERLRKKVTDLGMTRTISIQTLPQIRMIQNNDRVLIEKIHSTVSNTIPLWRNQVAISLAMNNQKKVLQYQQKVSDTTNSLLTKNAELLKQNTIETAKENEKTVVSVESLKKVNSELVATLEEVSKITQNGAKQREKIQKELNGIESDLKDRILNYNTKSSNILESNNEVEIENLVIENYNKD